MQHEPYKTANFHVTVTNSSVLFVSDIPNFSLFLKLRNIFFFSRNCEDTFRFEKNCYWHSEDFFISKIILQTSLKHYLFHFPRWVSSCLQTLFWHFHMGIWWLICRQSLVKTCNISSKLLSFLIKFPTVMRVTQKEQKFLVLSREK